MEYFLNKICKIIKRKGDFLKKIIKIIGIILILLLIIISIIFIENDIKKENISYAASSYGTSDIQLMARAINGEARGEPYEGQVAVGAVILNRVKSSKFPNTISGVIYQSGAFTAVSDGQINSPISEGSTVYKAARDAMNGWDPTGGCIYYFNPATATNKWIWSRPLVKTIGKHRFCK
ncbi:MAG: spore cortex-lytic enzyme SleB [Clostridia bacterium]|nr:spore cortex-lytic enzyme SleB [Clostridia bacterium]